MRKMVFSDHASERMFLRRISKSLVRTTLENHDELKSEEDGDICFIKSIQRNGSSKKMHVVAKQLPDQGKDTWLIKTVWIRGEEDPGPILKAIRMFLMRIFHKKKPQR